MANRGARSSTACRAHGVSVLMDGDPRPADTERPRHAPEPHTPPRTRAVPAAAPYRPGAARRVLTGAVAAVRGRSARTAARAAGRPATRARPPAGRADRTRFAP